MDLLNYNLILTATAIVSGVIIVHLLSKKRKYNLPPGPKGVPVLGYLPFINHQTAHLDFIELGKKYGDIFHIKLGLDDAVVINDFETMKEVLSKDEFQDRPENFVLKLFDPLGQLVTWSGKKWRSQRNFALRSLRSLGFGKSKFESSIHEEIEYLFRKMNQNGNRGQNSIEFRELIGPSISNVILSMTTGLRFDFDHEIRQNYDSLFLADNNELGFTLFFIFTYFPFLMRILMKIPTEISKKMNHFYTSCNQHLDAVIKNRRDELDKMSVDEITSLECHNYVDIYLKHMKTVRESEADARFFTASNLRGSAFTFLAAGSTTTMDAVQFFCLIMAINPDVQEKMYQEVLSVIGSDAQVSISDRSRLPITDAILHEVLRYATLLPINLPHAASVDAKIKNFDIPKGTLIFANLFAVHFNPKYFPEPETFNYERFLDADKKKFVKPEHFVPFSIGKRSCPGESMAMLELLLYSVSIIQKYQIFPERRDMKCVPVMNGFQRAPNHGFKLKFVPRN